MSALRIEHVNITVADPERTSGLMMALFDWHIRWRGLSLNGGQSIHVGSTDHYIALYSAGHAPEIFSKGMPLNHIGVEVDDLDATEARVISAGLKPFSHDDYDPGKRLYFFDLDGIEYEVIDYSNAAVAVKDDLR